MSEKPMAPQFVVETVDHLGFGATVRFNGQEVRNVTRVSVSNVVAMDDLVCSTLTLELVGEIVIVDSAIRKGEA